MSTREHQFLCFLSHQHPSHTPLPLALFSLFSYRSLLLNYPIIFGRGMFCVVPSKASCTAVQNSRVGETPHWSITFCTSSRACRKSNVVTTAIFRVNVEHPRSFLRLVSGMIRVCVCRHPFNGTPLYTFRAVCRSNRGHTAVV